MTSSVRLNDPSIGHPGHGPTPAISGSPNHFVNGRPVVRVGDSWKPAGTHTSIQSVVGSPNVFSGGQARVRTNDALSCGDKAGVGSSDVNVN